MRSRAAGGSGWSPVGGVPVAMRVMVCVDIRVNVGVSVTVDVAVVVGVAVPVEVGVVVTVGVNVDAAMAKSILRLGRWSVRQICKPGRTV